MISCMLMIFLLNGDVFGISGDQAKDFKKELRNEQFVSFVFKSRLYTVNRDMIIRLEEYYEDKM